MQIGRKKIIITTIILTIIFIVMFFNKSNVIVKGYRKINGYLNEKINNLTCNIEFDCENNITFKSNLKIDLKISNLINLVDCKMYVNDKCFEITDKDISVQFIIQKEGKNTLTIKIINNGEQIYNKQQDVYYVKKYEKQYADLLTKNGIGVHYRNGKDEDINKDLNLLQSLGINIIRDDFDEWFIEKDNKLNYSYHDNWISKISQNSDIKILAIINAKLNKEIFTQKDKENYYNFLLNTTNKYKDNFIGVEIFNEPNNLYSSENYKDICSQIIQNKKIKTRIIPGALNFNESNKDNNGFEYLNQMLNDDKLVDMDNISIHPYSLYNCNNFDSNNRKVYEKLNDYGGFIKLNATEYGTSSSIVNEEKQAIIDVQESVLLNRFMDMKILYNLWSTDLIDGSERFGLLDSSYLPKLVYFSIKKYYENTNGSEYIGKVNISNVIESYVYNKDGKPKIIAWATDDENKVDIDYSGFTAKDLYGNDIENKNGKVEISNSPVYLDNASTNYFYQAISNSIVDGYKEFNSKFANEISNVNGLSNKITRLHDRALLLKNLDNYDETQANELMKEHFELGNMVLDAYKNESFKVEYVKLSSMLDSLNTIGNSYEDLITVSAKTRMNDLSNITSEVNYAKKLAQHNEKFDIVYPNKIYKFAQDLLDTSSYVLGLEEENDIKTGLINSKAIHAKYLADWSQEFSKIYMQDALRNSVYSIKEQNKEIYQNYNSVIENSELSDLYNIQQDSIQNLLDKPEENTFELVDNLFKNQVQISNIIVDKYNNKELDITSEEFYKLLNNELDILILNNYSDLYKYYLKEENLDKTTIEKTLNSLIELYNNNLDINLNDEASMLNKLKNIYENKIETENASDNYLSKKIITEESSVIHKLLETKIKSKADEEYKSINATLDKDLNKLTNEDVYISLNLPNEKLKVINNDGKNQIKFSENGEFTFKINIRGYNYEYKVVVNNIDKKAPEINIDNANNSLSVDVKDENLKEIHIEKDGKEVNRTKDIIAPGIYKISAVDKANNASISKVIIYGTYKEDNEENKYISIDKTETKAKEIKDNSNFAIKENGQDVEDNSIVKTGDILISNNQAYTIIVKGDLTNSGKTGIVDLIKLRKQLVSIDELNPIDEISADLNNDNLVNIIDLIRLRKMIVGIDNY